MKTLLWANHPGLQSYLESLGADGLAGIVAPGNRPDEIEAVRQMSPAVPVLVQPLKSDKESFANFESNLNQIDADLFLVNSYSMILPESWLEIPRLGAINVHGGLLPQHRGANILNWVIVNGESESGVTIHVIDSGIDTGPVIAQERVAIAIDDTAFSLRDKLMSVATSMLRNVIPRFVSGDITPVPQDESRARHWRRRRPEDGLIDWSWPAERIYNLILCAVAPWPGAFYYNSTGEKVIIDEFVPIGKVREMKQRYLSCDAT